MSKFGGGIGAPSKDERLKNAAEIHIRLGQIQRYCELMVELGEVKMWCVCVYIYIILHYIFKTFISNLFNHFSIFLTVLGFNCGLIVFSILFQCFKINHANMVNCQFL